MITIEEKAKRYDEAIEKAKSKIKDDKDHVLYEDDIIDLFPELKIEESEDERIRKWCISHFKECINVVKNNDEYKEYLNNKVIPWFEKQGEHANFLNKIHIGDKVTRNEDGVLVNLSQLNRVAKKQTEQKLYVNDNAKEMFIKALERVEEQNNKGYKLTDCDKNSWWEDFKAYTSCTIEQKPAAWSDEDEKQARQIERIVHDDGCTQKLQKQIADWFKSLKERCNWKPSDEQIKAVKLARSFVVDDFYEHPTLSEILIELEEQLKKLKD